MNDEHIEHPEGLDPDEDLKMDNKIKRLELELKGAKFVEFNPMGLELPPQIEAQMLEQIMAIEKLKDQAQEVEVYTCIGRPKFKSIDNLSSEEIILEKERLLKLMARKGIFLTSMDVVEDYEMYRFITQEFFGIKILDLPVKGFARHFIYEDFYPNERLNAERLVEFFIQTYFGELDFKVIDVLCREETRTYLTNFKELYESFKLKHYELIYSEIKKIKGVVTIQIDVEAKIEGSLKTHNYSGEISVEVRKRKGHWQISKLEFPKIGT